MLHPFDAQIVPPRSQGGLDVPSDRLARARLARSGSSCLLAAAVLVAGQFRTTVDLVEVYAAVTKPGGGEVGDLTVNDFTVLENGVVQKVQTFDRGQFPLAVALAIDRSFSMTGAPLRLAREGARTFLGELRPDDEAVVIAVGSEVEPAGELSRDRAQQHAALDALTPWGSTSLHDAIVRVVDTMSHGRGRRALIILSDGQDRYSKASADDVIAAVRHSDVLVYGIALSPKPTALFEQLAALSGGRAFHVTTPQQFPGVFSTIARDLRTQYLLGYTPPPGPPGWRTIEVRVRRPDVRVRARSGYLAR